MHVAAPIFPTDRTIRHDPLEKVPVLHHMCEQAGRDPASIEVSIYGCPMREADVEA